ncbi:MAG: TldD/PmbA family protein [Planctomycetota bacterium]|nr:TldD/PmbA family protein [Planctomycetota bacterium]
MDISVLLDDICKVADSGEIYTLKHESTSLGFIDGRAKDASRKQEYGSAVRLLKDGRIGFSSARGPAELKSVIERALSSARFGEEADFQFTKSSPFSRPITYSDTAERLTLDRMREIGESVSAGIKEKCPDGVVQVSVGIGIAEHRIVNTAGTDVSEKFSHFYIGAGVEWVRGEEILLMHTFEVSVKVDEFVKKVVSDILRQLDWCKREAKLTSGAKEVLFGAKGGLSVVLVPLMAGLNGENIARRTSPLLSRTGEKLFSERLTLFDDGTLDYRVGSAVFDCEGTPVRKNALIENGILKGFIFDLKFGAMAKAASTGNGKRTSVATLPRPSFNNLVILRGDTPLEEMIKGVEDGVYIESALGVGQGNIISGAFSNPLGLAFRIERGEVTGKIGKASVAGNVYEILKRVEAVSKETGWWGMGRFHTFL